MHHIFSAEKVAATFFTGVSAFFNLRKYLCCYGLFSLSRQFQVLKLFQKARIRIDDWTFLNDHLIDRIKIKTGQ